MNSAVYTLTTYNNELIAGGYFTSAGGVSANCIAKWNGSIGNAPFYDTVVTKSVLLNVTGGTSVMQSSDGFVYICYISAGTIHRLIYDLTGVGNQNHAVNFSLAQNYPNPFNPATNINYEIPNQSFVSLRIFNAIGIEIKSLVNETKHQGKYEVSWDASAYPSGVYFYELTAGEFKERKKMVLIK